MYPATDTALVETVIETQCVRNESLPLRVPEGTEIRTSMMKERKRQE